MSERNESLSRRDQAALREHERLRQIWEHYASLSLDDVAQVLEHGSDSERSHAAQNLVQRQDLRAIEPLIRALADPNADAVAEYASEALVALGPQAVPHLIQALADGREPRFWLIRTLGNTHDPRACKPLSSLA